MSKSEYLRSESESLGIEVSKLANMYNYLEDLRESGITNMFGATPYLVSEFDLDRNIAIKVLSSWMGSFKVK